MSEDHVLARGVEKSFFVLKYHKTVLRGLKAFVRGEGARRRYPVLRDVTFRIRRGEKVALVGRNGCGKTTLLRLIAGIYAADGGELRVAEEPCALLDASVGTLPILSLRDNVYLFGALHNIDRPTLDAQMEDILLASGLSELRYAPYRDLSKGQRHRFALSVFMRTSGSFLIFDEALTNLDTGFVNECERQFAELRGSDRTVLLTSHDSDFLRRHCDRALWLEDGRIRMDGEADEVIDAYERSFA
jgi:ABC-2 type transport system ATP-binding protein